MAKIKNDDEATAAPIALDSDEREGNDVASLVGSGAPLVTVRAKANVLGLTAGAKGQFIQTEELRLLVQQGFAEYVE